MSGYRQAMPGSRGTLEVLALTNESKKGMGTWIKSFELWVNSEAMRGIARDVIGNVWV